MKAASSRLMSVSLPLLSSQALSLDVGSAMTRVMVGNQLVYHQPTCLTIHQPTQAVVEVGSAAYVTLGKNPTTIEGVFPIRYGVISQPHLTDLYLQAVLKIILADQKRLPIIFGLKATLAVPASLTPVERDTWIDVLRQVGFTQIKMVPKVLAIQQALSRQGLTKYRCVIDIGDQTTEVGLVNEGEVLSSTTIRMGSREYSREVLTLLRDEYQCEVGNSTAEKVKVHYRPVGETKPGAKSSDYKMTLRGKHVVTGVPTTVSVASSLLTERFKEVTTDLIREIHAFLAQAPAEVLTSALEDGMYVTGGGSLLPGVVELISQELKTHFSLSKHPQEDVVRGL